MPFAPDMKTIHSASPATSSSLLWLSDLHLDQVGQRQIDRLLDQIARSTADRVVITGDISKAESLIRHLRDLATAAAPRPISFVTGNHDYYGSSLDQVDAAIKSLCAEVPNLHFLDGEQIIPLSRHACLLGHRGWADARTGYRHFTRLRSPDQHAIRDFSGLTHEQSMLRMQELGKESASRIRSILPLALSRYRHVVVLTHVPPFPEAVLYDGAGCSPSHLPHYTSLSVGLAVRAIASASARAYPNRRITILAGHSHSASVTHIGTNICVRVAHARTGRPGPHEVLRIS
jgi:predicted phosphohydrolase